MPSVITARLFYSRYQIFVAIMHRAVIVIESYITIPLLAYIDLLNW